MNKKYLSATVMLLCASALPVLADNTVAPIIITATRTAQTVDDTLASVTVITRDDIERQQAKSVTDVLRGLPGITISNNGGPGKATSVFLRGTESDHVLVLIDGVKVGSVTLGTTAFQHIPLEQIDRIEIVRGPRSSLYGSEAIGGVIQIFTRKGGGLLKPFFSLGGGSNHAYKASAGVTGGGKRGWFSLSASGNRTEGFNACNGKPSPGGAGCFTIEPDNDGYRNVSGSLRTGYQFENGLEVDAHALRASGDNEFDGSFVNESESVQQVLGGTIRFSPADSWQLALAASSSRDESDNFKDTTFQTRFDTERDTVSLQNDLYIESEQLLTIGVNFQDDRVDSTTDFAVTSRNNTGLFTQYLGTFARHELNLSLRHDDNEQFGGHVTGSVAWGYRLENDMRLTVSYGTAFKAPTFNELFYPGFGNPNLRPEESRSVEIGINDRNNWGQWALNMYETYIDDLIAFDASIFAPANIDQARIRGLEAILTTQIKGWHLNANLNFLDPKNHASGSNKGNLLARRARQSLRLDADHQFDKYTLGTTLFVQGKRYDNLANTRQLGGYSSVDLRAEYSMNNAWRLQARIANLFDKEYQTAAFFNQTGRSVFMTLRYQR